jgi:nucleoside 2-deoxyribosyltransferase
MEIYLAAPLFSQAERVYNRRLKELLERLVPSCRVTIPQDFRIGRGSSFNDRRHLAALYRQCMEALTRCDLVLARLDGADADSGVAFEVGVARGIGKPVIGLRTDYRQLQDRGLNMMLAQGCTDIVCRFSFDERLEPLAEALVGRIEKALAARARGPNAGERP